ncbi:MAG: phosphatase PAP2 family protein [candidate division Zixibacteria bacterium]
MSFESGIRNSFSLDKIIGEGNVDSAGNVGKGRHLFDDLKNAGKIYLSDSWHIYSAPGRLTRTDVLWLAGIISVGGTIYTYDRDIYNAFKRNQNHALYKPIRQLGDNIEKIGHMGITGKYFFGALVTGYIFDIKPMTRISSQIIEAFFITGGVKNVATIAIGRTRPHEGNGPEYFRFNEDGTSFPSGHSINVLEIADILSHNIDYRPFQISCYGLASVVCLQRITSDSHWPSDVYFSAIFGWVVSHELQKRHQGRKREITIVPFINEESTGLKISINI